MNFYDLCGWLGIVFVVTSYYFVTVGRWGTHTKIDEVFNIIASILVGVNVYHSSVWPAFTLQIVWASIAAMSLIRKIKKVS